LVEPSFLSLDRIAVAAFLPFSLSFILAIDAEPVETLAPSW